MPTFFGMSFAEMSLDMESQQTKDKLVNVRVDEELWKKARIRALEEGVSISEVFRRLLELYVRNGVPEG